MIHELLSEAASTLATAAPGEHAAVVLEMTSSRAHVLGYDGQGNESRLSPLESIPRHIGDSAASVVNTILGSSAIAPEALAIMRQTIETGAGDFVLTIDPFREVVALTFHSGGQRAAIGYVRPTRSHVH